MILPWANTVAAKKAILSMVEEYMLLKITIKSVGEFMIVDMSWKREANSTKSEWPAQGEVRMLLCLVSYWRSAQL